MKGLYEENRLAITVDSWTCNLLLVLILAWIILPKGMESQHNPESE